jgi:hypothetical protein
MVLTKRNRTMVTGSICEASAPKNLGEYGTVQVYPKYSHFVHSFHRMHF